MVALAEDGVEGLTGKEHKEASEVTEMLCITSIWVIHVYACQH